MSKEQPYIRIETCIRQTVFGTERTDKIIEKSSNMPKDFLESLWDDYSIDVDVLEEK